MNYFKDFFENQISNFHDDKSGLVDLLDDNFIDGGRGLCPYLSINEDEQGDLWFYHLHMFITIDNLCIYQHSKIDENVIAFIGTIDAKDYELLYSCVA